MAEQPKDSVIFHCDCNAFYASVEALDNPALREVPVAVAGSPESRRGIVLAKNEQAKARGIFTTQTVWQAKKLCPELMLVPPRHDRYAEISRQVNALYMQYTDLVEPASIDESYLDVTGSLPHFGLSAHALGDQVRWRVREEIGITISVGISFCKAFAKMGSDLKKPDATTEITRENYRDILWPLPVGALLYAGKRTCEQLRMQGIHTVGDLARTDRQALAALLGRGGDALWLAANGLEDAPVVPPEEQPDVLLCSPYLRAVETARRLLQVGEMPTTLRVDERLREKEFGVLDRYTRYGIQQKFPDLFEQRAHVGTFYFRPPGGESWCDVILRLRSFMEMTAREYDGQRVLVVGHQVIVSCLRYLLEGLAEQEILAIDREGDVPNCGVTSYHFHAEGFRDGRLVPRLVNFTAPLEQAGTPVTAAKDVPAAPKA